jgi:hypothetical protein
MRGAHSRMRTNHPIPDRRCASHPKCGTGRPRPAVAQTRACTRPCRTRARSACSAAPSSAGAWHSVTLFVAMRLAACTGTAEAVPRRNKLPGHGCVARPFSYCIRPHPAVPQFAWLVSGRCNAPSFVWLAAGLNVVAVAAASTWTVLTLVRRRCRVSVTRI